MKEITIEGNRTRVKTVNILKSRTQQQFKKETDINHIIRKYKNTGILPAAKLGRYLDVSNLPDYHASMNQIIEAQNAFNALDSQIRTKFQNDPQQLLQFLQNPQNYDEGVKLGLLKPKNSLEQTKNDLNETHTSPDASKPQT